MTVAMTCWRPREDWQLSKTCREFGRSDRGGERREMFNIQSFWAKVIIITTTTTIIIIIMIIIIMIIIIIIIIITSGVLEHKWLVSLCTNETLQNNISVHF